ncbi:MAG: ribonuclease G [Psychromonas sp.]|nr:ribonuclease G [Psychromonas sp.]
MSVELLMNITPSETRVALIEGGVLQELHIERAVTKSVVGNVYKGKIVRVLSGMQAAFVDIGLDKAAFLHINDIAVYKSSIASNKEKSQTTVSSDIADFVRPGQDLIVQIIKDPLGTKGARLTTDLTVPSRYLVFIPGNCHIGVSQRIESSEERQRLKAIATSCLTDLGGFIIRTSAEGVDESELRQDAAFLQRVWTKVLKRKSRLENKNKMIYGDLILSYKILRDFVGTKIDRVRIDSKQTHEQLIEFTQEFIPELDGKVECYTGELPIFDLFNVEREIQRALEKKVSLKSGGYIVIDQTEAMTTVDINTGGFVGHRNLEDTIFNTNLEATSVIARQLRLRNLGGIIILDFIDMKSNDHKRRVFSALEQALAKDRIKTNVHNFSPLGLIEMTRKRTQESLEHIFCTECKHCNGRGSVKTVETVCYEVLREVLRVNKAFSVDEFNVYTSTAVADSLLNSESDNLGELIQFMSKKINIYAEPLYGQEQFDVVMV